MDFKKPSVFHFIAGLVLGVVLGVAVYEAGIAYACPSKTCVDSAEIIPISDKGYFDHAHRILSGARKSIHIVSFEVKYYRSYPDSLENRLVRDLIYARERGVEVKVLVDDYSKENNAYDILRENKVEVKMDSNETTTHAKLIIVDGKIVLLGSTNLSYYGLEENNEVDVLIKDYRTGQYYERYFASLWGES
jgi:phosphatidylserine/phosphatidylglycerophosphate/cardiolipin synthase-like enzyme